MATQGPNYTGTGSDDSAVGTKSWTNPTNIQTDNGIFTTVPLKPSGVTHYIKALNFGFTIPSGATINGVFIEIKKQIMGAVSIKDTTVKLVKGGTVSGSNYANTSTNWSGTMGYVNYGSGSDLWGLSLSYTDVNASTFGVVLSATTVGSKSGNSGYIDAIRMTITYTAAPTTSIKAVGTVVQASISKIGGQTSANIKKIGGVANQ